LRPRELTGIVVVQALVIAVLALLVGVPLGLVIVAPAWGAAAQQLGVADDVAGLPFLDLALLVSGVLVATLLLAALPGRSAARTRPAVVLHAE
jgi:ABC-type antimicrobial peptide transport system permease subunit